MTTEKSAIGEFTAPGLHWLSNGQSVITGPLLDLYKRLDLLFLSWAAEWKADDYLFPVFIPASELNKVDYLRSFPHLVTFPVNLNQNEEDVEAFCSENPVDEKGCVHLTQTAPVADCMTPAACLHIYATFQGREFPDTAYFTTKNNIFRREAEYQPLQRQWNFSMREIVCVGTSDEVQAFLKETERMLTEFFLKTGLPVTFENATDPFFKPTSNPKWMMQKLAPTKREMVFDKKLAIGSVNYHRSHFTEAFRLTRDGVPLSSGCVGFGLERWLYAIVTTMGDDFTTFPSEGLINNSAGP